MYCNNFRGNKDEIDTELFSCITARMFSNFDEIIERIEDSQKSRSGRNYTTNTQYRRHFTQDKDLLIAFKEACESHGWNRTTVLRVIYDIYIDAACDELTERYKKEIARMKEIKKWRK